MKSVCRLSAIAIILSIPSAIFSQTISPEQFRQMLVEELKRHPEIVQMALNEAQARAEAEAAQFAKAGEHDMRVRARSSDTDMPILGDPRATITVVEALDYRCPHCRAMWSRIDELLKSRRDVRVAVLMTPILGSESSRLARFALAAQLQGRFAQVHDALLSSVEELENDNELAAISAKAGVNWPLARAAMNEPTVRDHLMRDNLAWKRLNMPGTPFFILPDRSFEGEIDLEVLSELGAFSRDK